MKDIRSATMEARNDRLSSTEIRIWAETHDGVFVNKKILRENLGTYDSELDEVLAAADISNVAEIEATLATLQARKQELTTRGARRPL